MSTPQPLTGIDVSHYQSNINWPEVATNPVGFAMMKATQGTGFVDPMFQANWKEANAAGIRTGAYHYFMPEKSFLDQAQLLLDQLAAVRYDPAKDLPPAIDCEVTDGVSNAALTFALASLVNILQRQLGVKPMIYTSPGFWNGIGNPDFSECPLWIAEYTNASEPAVPSTWSGYAIWQYSQSGSVNGIEGPVDLNRLGNAMLPMSSSRRVLDWF